MFRGRRKLPVLAEISDPAPGEGRPGSLGRTDLEAFEALLAALWGSRLILVTGAEDGRRVAALGLATAAAAAGRHTALLECDMARPTLAGALGLAVAPGLHEYLSHEASAAEILQPAVLAGPASARAIAPLVCLVGGRPAADASSLLASGDFSHATAKLRKAYDTVVVEGPPLARDGKALDSIAALADTALACVPRSAASGRQAKAVELRLRRLPAPVAGLVLIGERDRAV